MSKEQATMIYSLDDSPPAKTSFFLGLQHVFTTFGINVTVPFLIGPMIGMSQDQMAVLIGAVLLTAGVTTLLQATLGSRLPVFQGSSFAFIGPYIAIFGVVGGMGAEATMQHIAGAIILGSLFEIAVGFSGILGKLQKYVSPVVIGPVIMLIGLSMFKVGAVQAAENWFLSILVIVATFVFSLVLGKKNKFFSMFSILSAIVVGYLVALIMGEVSFDSIRNAQWIRTQIVFPWGLPKFDIGFALIALAGYLPSIIESYGDYHAVNSTAGGPPLTNKQISRGIGMEGLGCLLTGIWGGFSNTSLTGNIGAVGLTRVASRKIAVYGASISIFLGLFGKFSGAVATIPRPVLGGLFCVLFGLISSIGLRTVAKADLNSVRNSLIIGFIIYMGFSVPHYFSQTEIVIPSAPWLAQIVSALGSTGIAVTAFLGLILDNIIPGSRKERGFDSDDAEEDLVA